ncbi:aminotransferase class IV [Caulobacter sp. NIBR2454]|uniref:aminotransferase class IV n=1 Tax=Caulobacter sp. NIBR2454 TaxID=3015996 RepID=UPI0022B6D2D0|nr:aminotransferase class IV [Caulobacter sp. NIBR2454]
MIPHDDRGLLLGDGLFETMLVVDGRMPHWAAHWARLMAGCATLGLPLPDEFQTRVACTNAVAVALLNKGRAAVRLTLTAGSGGRGLERPPSLVARVFATASPAPDGVQAPAQIITSHVRRNEGSPTSRLKTLAYLDNVLARRQALAAGADEALMLNTGGEVACATAANLFWINGDALFTPSLECGVLAGTTRARVIALAKDLRVPVVEGAFAPDAIHGSEGAFLTNSLIGLRAISRLDGKAMRAHRLFGALAGRL